MNDILKITSLVVLVLIFSAAGWSIYSHNLKEKEFISKNLGFQPEAQVPTKPLSLNPGRLATSTISQVSKDYKFDPNACSTFGGTYLCFADFYKNLVKKFGVQTAMKDIETRAPENPTVLNDCHPLTHVIGREAALSYTSVSEAFAKGDSYCWSGYYHGIMEGMISKIGKDNLPKELNNICADIPGKDKYSFDYFNCVHGLGHGIMALSEDEVFDSLKMCDNLTGDWEQSSCYSGVYMQNIIDSTNVADTDNVVKYLKPEEPMYPCTAVEDKYKSQCYLGQSSYALQVTNYNFPKVFQMCAAVAEPYRDICNQSMGRDVANQSNHEPNLTKTRCDIPNNENDTTNCIVGAVKEIISYYHSDVQAKDFCNIVDQKYKSICNNVTNSYYSYF